MLIFNHSRALFRINNKWAIFEVMSSIKILRTPRSGQGKSLTLTAKVWYMLAMHLKREKRKIGRDREYKEREGEIKEECAIFVFQNAQIPISPLFLFFLTTLALNRISIRGAYSHAYTWGCSNGAMRSTGESGNRAKEVLLPRSAGKGVNGAPKKN